MPQRSMLPDTVPVRVALVAWTLAALVALAGLGIARAAELTGTARADRLVGTPRADTIRGRGGNDRIEGRDGGDLLHGGAGRDLVLGQAGPDRIALHTDGAPDRALCGAGVDVVNAELPDTVDDACEVVTRQLSRDTFDVGAQHETQVEPDSIAFGSTIVTVFQSGRLVDGGAAAIGWATSADAGRTWRSGVLERVGDRVSDPVVAYDRLRGVWLIAILAASLGEGEDSTQLYVSRSRDGLAWSRPELAAGEPTEGYDKEWLVCDTWPSSRFYGRCYLTYLDLGTRQIRTRQSSDGARTWSAPVTAPVESEALTGNGAYPVVRPDGAVLVLFSVYGSFDPGIDAILASRSLDGGATFEQARRVASLSTEEPGLRAPPFVSADVDAGGTVYVTWADCRFSSECHANGIVLTTSRDGVAWTPPRRVPFGPANVPIDHFVPALAVAPGTSGATARVAVVAYAITQAQGCRRCETIDAYLLTSRDGGRTWGTRRRLNAESVSIEWIANTALGRMLGDYISVSFVDGRPMPVLSLADAPVNGEFRQAIFATTRVP